MHFKKFGFRYVVVGSADEIAAAVKTGHADVTMRDGTVKRVTVDRSKGQNGRYVTKAGETTWTFGGESTAAFVPFDDRSDDEKGKGKAQQQSRQQQSTTPVPPPAPASPPVDLSAIDPTQVRAMFEAMGWSVTPPAPASAPVPSPNPAPAPNITGADCYGCGQPAVGKSSAPIDGEHRDVCRAHRGKSSAATKRDHDRLVAADAAA